MPISLYPGVLAVQDPVFGDRATKDERLGHARAREAKSIGESPDSGHMFLPNCLPACSKNSSGTISPVGAGALAVAYGSLQNAPIRGRFAARKTNTLPNRWFPSAHFGPPPLQSTALPT